MCFRILFALIAFAFTGLASANGYPEKPITVVVPAPPGGATDSLARHLGEEMSRRLGQPIIIENKPGASGMLGVQSVIRAKPDGYTLLVVQSTAVLTVPLLQARLPYDARRDLAFVSQLSGGPYLFVVNKDVPASNVQEFIAWAAKNKGKVNYGSYAVGGYSHLIGSFMSQSKGLDMTPISYKGESPMLLEIANGQISFGIATQGATAPHLAAGRVRVLAVFGDRRTKALPNVPTMTEAGLVEPEYKPIGWVGLMAPAGTPAAIIDRLQAVAREAVRAPKMYGHYDAFGGEPIGSSAKEFRQNFEASLPIVERMIKNSGAKAE